MLLGIRCDAPFGWISLFGFSRKLLFLTTEDAEFGTEGTEQGAGEEVVRSLLLAQALSP